MYVCAMSLIALRNVVVVVIFLTLTYNEMCLPYCKTSDFQDLIDEFQIKDNVEFFRTLF